MAGVARSRKRAAGEDLTGITPVPTPKRTRFEINTKLRSEDGTHGGQGFDVEDSNSSPLDSPSVTEEQSVAETSRTSVSSSRRPKKYLCEYDDCGKAFDRPARLQIHIRSHTNERPFACEEPGCGKTFPRAEHLKRHTIDRHSDEREYACTYSLPGTDGDAAPVQCDKNFTTATRLRRHVAAHESKEETTCPEPGCGKNFRKLETLQRHIRRDHLHEKGYQCDHVDTDENGESVECGQSFGKSAQLQTHRKRVHSGLRYYCEICSPDPHAYDDHDHASQELDLDLSELALGPPRVSFPTYAELQLHHKTAHPPTCSTCGKQVPTTKALAAHMDIAHTDYTTRQNVPCTWPGCTRAFTKAGNLKVHVQTVHVKAKDWVCGGEGVLEADNKKVEGWDRKGCGRAFGMKANLEEHIRTQHLGLVSQVRPSILKKKQAKVKPEPDDEFSPDGAMDFASPDAEYRPSVSVERDVTSMAMLTGFGYEAVKKIPCLVQGCQMRFAKEHDLAPHLELTHEWNIDDVNERLAEREALGGGAFWVGRGLTGMDHAVGGFEPRDSLFVGNEMAGEEGMYGEENSAMQRAQAQSVIGLKHSMVGLVGKKKRGPSGRKEAEVVVDPALMQM